VISGDEKGEGDYEHDDSTGGSSLDVEDDAHDDDGNTAVLVIVLMVIEVKVIEVVSLQLSIRTSTAVTVKVIEAVSL